MIAMYDASTPPAGFPMDCKIVAGYIGGATPHVWTKQEWARFDGKKKLPIYVPTEAVGRKTGAVTEGFTILSALYALKVPKGTAVVIDMETSVADAFDIALADVIHWAGYLAWIYGSLSTIFENPPLDGEWVADYAGTGPFMVPGRNVAATQWGSGTRFDSSAVKWWRYRHQLAAW